MTDMKYNVRVVYDDMARKSEAIEDVIGNHGFANVVVKKKKLLTYYMENLTNIFQPMTMDTLSSIYDLDKLYHDLNTDSMPDNEERIIHCFSNFIFSDFEQAQLSFRKVHFINQTYKMISGENVVAISFSNRSAYLSFLARALKSGGSDSTKELTKDIVGVIPIEGMTNIGEMRNFIQCITGNFDARFFNSLQGDDFIVVKRSTNKKKIKMEYQFYQMLPDDMKYWFVMPFHYEENNEYASYMMERLHMTDVAIKWVHGSFSQIEFEELLDKYFFFFNCRHRKEVSACEYDQIADALYIDKVAERIDDLIQLPEYGQISNVIHACGVDIRDLYSKYLLIKEKIESTKSVELVSVIGHGDPCFSNALYSKFTRTLKFIDPKGALEPCDLWTNPYYDLAKLSHSICGLYDFINNNLFEIYLNESFEYMLKIDFDNQAYVDIFKRKLGENGFDYQLVRLYEASLFLSMLPLHIDVPYKVVGFILNAKRILEELSENDE